MKEKDTLDERIAAFRERVESSDLYAVVSAKSDIANLVFDAMEARAVSRAELARRLGKSRAYVSKLLGGGTNMTVETLVLIARALDCHWSEFVPRPAAPSVAPGKNDVRDELAKPIQSRPKTLKRVASKTNSQRAVAKI